MQGSWKGSIIAALIGSIQNPKMVPTITKALNL